MTDLRGRSASGSNAWGGSSLKVGGSGLV
jgi:hypothetical protein